MSFFPPITSIQDFNAYTRDCACACEMPGCFNPLIEGKYVTVGPCFWQVMEGNCLKLYRTRKFTDSINESGTIDLGGTTYPKFTHQKLFTRTQTQSPPTVGQPCTITEECEGSGFYTLNDYFYQPEANGRGPFGPFTAGEINGTYQLGDGLPDPLWTPGQGQTEEDRPVLPPCTWLYTYTETIYTADLNSFGDLIGSTLLITNTGATWGFIQGDLEYIDEIDCGGVRGLLQTPDFDEGFFETTYPIAFFNCVTCEAPSLFLASWTQYRWTVPPEHEGPYYRIDWDEVFYPQDFLDWQSNPVGPPPVLPTLTAKSWEWQGIALGPCCGEETDTYEDRLADETRKSPWGVLTPPNDAGRKELANVRVMCYRNPYSNLPWAVSGFPLIDLESYEQP